LQAEQIVGGLVQAHLPKPGLNPKIDRSRMFETGIKAYVSPQIERGTGVPFGFSVMPKFQCHAKMVRRLNGEAWSFTLISPPISTAV